MMHNPIKYYSKVIPEEKYKILHFKSKISSKYIFYREETISPSEYIFLLALLNVTM
jgi:hypothetical protein